MIVGMERIAQRHGPQWLRWGILIAVLGVLPVLGVLGHRLPLAYILVMVGILLGAVALVRHLELGLLAILLVGVFVEYSLPTGTGSSIVLGLVLSVACVGLWLLRMAVLDKRFTLRPAPTNRPLLAFMATVAVSWFWSRAFRDPLVVEAGHPLVSVAAAVVMIMLPACYLLAANTISSLRWLVALVWTLLGAGLVVVLVDLGAWFGVQPASVLLRAIRANRLVTLNAHGLLSMWCLSFALALALINRRLSKITRGLLLLYAGAWTYWAYVLRVTWLSGWVPAFTAAAVVAFCRSKKLFVALMIVIVVGVGRPYVTTHLEAEMEESGETRWQAYVVNWRVTGKHILFGTGPAGYASYYMSYFPHEAMATHSNYLDIISQTGIVGSAFFLWFLGAQAWGGYRIRCVLQDQGDMAESLTVAVLAATGGCAVALGLGDWLLPFAYTQTIMGFDLAVLNWIFLGAIWGLRRHVNFPSTESGPRFLTKGVS